MTKEDINSTIEEYLKKCRLQVDCKDTGYDSNNWRIDVKLISPNNEEILSDYDCMYLG